MVVESVKEYLLFNEDLEFKFYNLQLYLNPHKPLNSSKFVIGNFLNTAWWCYY